MKLQFPFEIPLHAAGPQRIPKSAIPGHAHLSRPFLFLASGVAHYARHTLRETGPALLFLHELLPALGGYRVEARLPVLLGDAPFGPHPTLLLHAVQRRVERTLFHA